MKNNLRPKVIVMCDKAKLSFIQRIRFELNIIQKKVAGYLSEKEQKLTTNRKKIYFFLFVGTFSSYFLYITVSGFFNPNTTALKFGNIHSSKIHEQNNTGGLSFREIRVMNYLQFLDSLKTTKSGKIRYEKIIKQNPGLIDTLTFIKSQILPTYK